MCHVESRMSHFINNVINPMYSLNAVFPGVRVGSRLKWSLIIERFNRMVPKRKKPRIQKDVNYKSQKRRTDANNTPSVLVKGNLFTPETANEKEVSILSYNLVRYGFADCEMLTRYLKCAKENINNYKTKTVISVLQAVSMYVSKVFKEENQISITAANGNEKMDDPVSMKQLFLSFFDLLKTAAPKFKKTACRMHVRDLTSMAYSVFNLATASLEHMGSSIDKEFNDTILKLLKLLADEIETKFEYCGMYECVMLTNTYSKLVAENWALEFLFKLSQEASAILLEKRDDMSCLLDKVYIGDDLFEELVRLPKDLCNLIQPMSRIKSCHLLWQHATQCIELYIELSRRDDLGFKLVPVPLTRIAILAQHINSEHLLLEALNLLQHGKVDAKSHILMSLIVASVRGFKNVEIAKKFYCNLNLEDVHKWSTGLVVELITMAKIIDIKPEHADILSQQIDKGMDLKIATALYCNFEFLPQGQFYKLESIIQQRLDEATPTILFVLTINGNLDRFPKLQELLKSKLALLNPLQVLKLHQYLKDKTSRDNLLLVAINDILGKVHATVNDLGDSIRETSPIYTSNEKCGKVNLNLIKSINHTGQEMQEQVHFEPANDFEIDAIAKHLKNGKNNKLDTTRLKQDLLEPMVKGSTSTWPPPLTRKTLPSKLVQTRPKRIEPRFESVCEARDEWKSVRSRP
ncbi:hypothetical protein BdWA1_001075 [Babesia duncani]|uniref:Uncharacterized protein n=1 Tax=Babesia duncani TaxID=323732 RepID=A0AAD9UQM5_9APIC|nr:hypothetical protein BdWA1_001075 [Babesia duncani]